MKKIRIALFLGAGASVPYGKPTTMQLKNKLKPPDSEIRKDFRNLILTCPSYFDFEHIYFNALKIRDFINSSAGEFFRYVSESQNALFTYRSPGDNHVKFHETMSEWNEIVTSLENDVFNNYTWTTDSDTDLQTICDPIFDYLKDKSSEILVFSTNYDKAIETYCELKNYYCVDGFKNIMGTSRWINGRFYYPNIEDDKTYVYLYKLHGSLDWKQRISGDIIKTNEEGRPVDSKYKSNLLIYPTLDPKPREYEPFTTIVTEFLNKIESVDVCIVIGFSFRDKYIADLFNNFRARKKFLIIIDEKGYDNFFNNLIKIAEPPMDSIVELPNGINSHNILAESTHIILHNLNPNKVQEIVWAIDHLLKFNRII